MSSSDLALARRVAFLESLVAGYKSKNVELLNALARVQQAPQADGPDLAQALQEERALSRSLERQVDALSSEVQELRKRAPAAAAVRSGHPNPSDLARLRRYYQQRIESAATAALTARRRADPSDANAYEQLVAEMIALRARVEEIDGPSLTSQQRTRQNSRSSEPPLEERDDSARSIESIRRSVEDKRMELARMRASLSQAF